MRRRRSVWACLALGPMLAWTVGCFPPTKPEAFRDLQQQVDQSRLENQELKTKIEALSSTAQSQQELIASLRNVGQDRLQQLNVVDRIELASLTGGADYDGQPGDDGVTVYLRPLDLEGDILKATGEMVIKLVDNAGEGTPRLLGVYSLKDGEEIRKAWHGGFMANHYTIKCPWPAGPEGMPGTNEVEIKATFLDYLTGRSVSANKVVTVTMVGKP